MDGQVYDKMDGWMDTSIIRWMYGEIRLCLDRWMKFIHSLHIKFQFR